MPMYPPAFKKCRITVHSAEELARLIGPYPEGWTLADVQIESNGVSRSAMVYPALVIEYQVGWEYVAGDEDFIALFMIEVTRKPDAGLKPPANTITKWQVSGMFILRELTPTELMTR